VPYERALMEQLAMLLKETIMQPIVQCIVAIADIGE
jgi:hypothetical protein